MKIIDKFSIFFFLILFTFSFSQNIKVTYSYKPSDIFEFEENVYIDNNYKISIVDSIPVKKYKMSNNGSDVYIEQDKGIKQYRQILVDNGKKGDIYYTYQIKKTNFLVTDNPPEIKWNLKYKETKKIGKYNCKKATAKFRGTDLEAWYTLDIPVPIGPYKFRGLPGLMLEVKTLGINKMSWTAKNIQYPYKGTANFSKKYISSLKKIGIKELIKKLDARIDEERRIFYSKLDLPMPAKIEVSEGNPRGVVENKFEWE